MGMLSASVGALTYTVACRNDGTAFVAIWYAVACIIMATAGDQGAPLLALVRRRGLSMARGPTRGMHPYSVYREMMVSNHSDLMWRGRHSIKRERRSRRLLVDITRSDGRHLQRTDGQTHHFVLRQLPGRCCSCSECESEKYGDRKSLERDHRYLLIALCTAGGGAGTSASSRQTVRYHWHGR